jgi:hypothetical protein
LNAILFAGEAWAQTPRPVLLSRHDSTRAISLESVVHSTEPYAPDSTVQWGPDRRTRVEVFAMNLALQPSEDLSAVTAGAEDASGRKYDLSVEYVVPLPGFEWMTAVSLRLSDDLSDVGDVLVWISYHGAQSNRVRVAIGHVGGGPVDDAGAVPTPPRFISGRVTSSGNGIEGVKVLVSGTQSLSLLTAADGSYSFLASPLGSYTVTPQLQFYDFGPPSRTYAPLEDDQSDADFAAARQTRAVSGQLLDDDGRVLPNVSVMLTSADGFEPMTTSTDGEGRFAFGGVPAGFDYTLTPGSDAVVSFTATTIKQLADDLALVIRGTRRKYSISGHVEDYAGGVGGVTFRIEGVGTGATTDAAGNFQIGGLKAGLDYALDASDADYTLDQTVFEFHDIQSDVSLDVHATPHFVLSGRVTDASGKGVFGINLNLTGTQTSSLVTSADGSYSFVVTLHGDYAITPLVEQEFYTFGPQSQSVNALKSGRAALDFTSTFNASFNPSYVLEYDGTPMTAEYGSFWDQTKPLGHFFWETWAMPGPRTSGGYMISDGYGGAHAILFGFGFLDGSEPNHYQLIGNTWDGSGIVSFASDEGPQVGEWGHYAVGWDGQYIVTYFDGVPVGRVKFDGTRQPGQAINGAGHLLVGGSDHSNFQGRLAQIRGFEGVNPREGDGSDNARPYASFTPETVFKRRGNFLSYYFNPGFYLTDLSEGYGGQLHTGYVRGTQNSYLMWCEGCPVPKFVVDPTAPDFSKPDNPGQTPAPAPTPAALPAGALVFDSFSRVNSTYILAGMGGLGASEGGASGRPAWQTGVAATEPQPFGILNGRAVLLANQTSVAWVSTGGQSDLDVRVDRRPRGWGTGQNTGISFRVADPANYFFAYTSEGATQADPKLLTLGYYLDGVRTNLVSGLAIPSDPQTPWITLHVLTRSDGTIQVLTDSTQLYSTTSGVLASATGAGLYNDSPGLGLTNRWDNFAIFAAP